MHRSPFFTGHHLRTWALCAFSVLVVSACGRGSTLADRHPGEAATTFLRALRSEDRERYCGMLRWAVIGAQSSNARLPDQLQRGCLEGEFFIRMGALDVERMLKRSAVEHVEVRKHRASVTLSTGGLIGLRRVDGHWSVVCLATKTMAQGNPGFCTVRGL